MSACASWLAEVETKITRAFTGCFNYNTMNDYCNPNSIDSTVPVLSITSNDVYKLRLSKACLILQLVVDELFSTLAYFVHCIASVSKVMPKSTLSISTLSISEASSPRSREVPNKRHTNCEQEIRKALEKSLAMSKNDSRTGVYYPCKGNQPEQHLH